MKNAVESKARRPQVPARPTASFAAGTPGRLTEWGFRLIQEACAAFGRSFHLADPETAGSGDLVLTTAPDKAFRRAAEGTTPILFLGDPLSDFAYQQQIAIQPQSQTLRSVSASASMIRDAARPGAVLVRERGASAHAAIAQVLRAFGFSLSDPAAAALVERFAGARDMPLAKAIERFPAGTSGGVVPPLDDITAGLVAKTIAPIFQATSKPEKIIWPRVIFFNGDRPGEPALPWVEVAGGARILYYGPYLHLPRGRWNVSSTLCFSDDLESTVFSIEVVWGTRPLGRGRVRPQRAGTFYAAFDVDVPSGAEAIEVRISTDQGSIFGRMALIEVAFQPAEAISPPAEPPS